MIIELKSVEQPSGQDQWRGPDLVNNAHWRTNRHARTGSALLESFGASKHELIVERHHCQVHASQPRALLFDLSLKDRLDVIK